MTRSASTTTSMSSREICPACNGGVSRERSLSVVDHGTYTTFKCYRASCGHWGRYNNGDFGDAADGERQSRPEMPHSRPVTAQELLQWQACYPTTDQDVARLRLRYVDADKRWWYPVLDPTGHERGGAARATDGRTPKAVVYSNEPQPWTAGSWYVKDGDVTTVLLVEDQVSAAKAALYVTTVALIGCNISEALTEQLLKYTKNVYIALDKDAIVKSTELARKLTPLFDSVGVILLERDIKDCYEIPKCIQELQSRH